VKLKQHGGETTAIVPASTWQEQAGQGVRPTKYQVPLEAWAY